MRGLSIGKERETTFLLGRARGAVVRQLKDATNDVSIISRQRFFRRG
jgi:hypothetical protein